MQVAFAQPIGYVDATVGCHRDTVRVIELPVARALSAPLANVNAVGGKLLDAAVTPVYNHPGEASTPVTSTKGVTPSAWAVWSMIKMPGLGAVESCGLEAGPFRDVLGFGHIRGAPELTIRTKVIYCHEFKSYRSTPLTNRWPVLRQWQTQSVLG